MMKLWMIAVVVITISGSVMAEGPQPLPQTPHAPVPGAPTQGQVAGPVTTPGQPTSTCVNTQGAPTGLPRY